MYSFQRITDYEFIRQVLTHPKIYDRMADDFSPKPENFRPVEDPRIWYVRVSKGPEQLGLWIFTPHSRILWEIHTALLPAAWGQAAEAGREMLKWWFSRTGCEALITHVPEFNRLARKLALESGMREWGLLPSSYKKRGKLYSQIVLGMARTPQKCP